MNKLEIQIDRFAFSKKESTFIKNIHLVLNSGDFNFLIGLSGIGKTTLLKIVMGILSDYGEMRVDYYVEKDKFTHNQIKLKGQIGFISQTPTLIPWDNIRLNLELPYKLNKTLSKPSSKEIKKELENFGLEGSVLKLMPHELSFGMQARVGIVRALLYRPRFLFLDELFTGIDTITSLIIANRIKDFIKKNKIVCLSVTHNIDAAVRFANNIFAFDKSRKLLSAAPPFEMEKILGLIR